MRRKLFSLLCFCGSCLYTVSAFAWGAHEHPLIAERALGKLASNLHLRDAVPIAPFDRFLAKIAPLLDIAPTPTAFADFLRISPAIDIAKMAAGETVGAQWPALRIVAVHSNDPDDGRDENVVDDPDVKYLGGRESQAFRHIEKPAVRWTDLTHTISFPFRELGEASVRAQIYFDLARLTWQIGEPYWAWRWLACSLHYIEDLTQPYHATQANSHGRYLLATLKVYLQTFGKKSFLKTGVQLLSNSHYFYEDLVSAYIQMAEEGRPRDARAIGLLEAMDGERAAIVPDVRAFAKTMRDTSNQRAADLLAAVFDISDARLVSLYEYPQPGDYPEAFLTPERDLDFLAAERQFLALSQASLQLAGDATRSLVASFVAQRGNDTPPALIAHLRKMLAE